MEQGERSDRFYIISQGQVEVTLRREDGQEVYLATLGPGQYFGEIGLLTDTPRTATVRARTGVELLSMDRETFRSVMEASERTAGELQQIARERAARRSSEREGAGAGDASMAQKPDEGPAQAATS